MRNHGLKKKTNIWPAIACGIAALREDCTALIALLPPAVESGGLNKSNFDTFPVFDDFRGDSEIAALVQNQRPELSLNSTTSTLESPPCLQLSWPS